MTDIAIFLPSLAGGGVGRSMLTLARLFAERGRSVDLVLCREEGDFRQQVPAGINIVTLSPGSVLSGRRAALRANGGDLRQLLRPVLLPFAGAAPMRFLPALADYLRSVRPGAVLSAKTHTNLVAILARDLAGLDTPLVVSERSSLSAEITGAKSRKWRWRYIAPLVRELYPRADAIVAVSKGVASDLAMLADLPAEAVTTVYNPVVGRDIERLAARDPPHPWLTAGQTPVVLGAGRLTEQKDFATLLRAFARQRRERDIRLIVLGEGEDRPALERQARDLGIAEYVALPGFQQNPFAWMARAAVFALSSRYEGLPGVLIQAMACGCKVVSTDCPSGPSEILDDGIYGPLVPVADDAAMARAIGAMLDIAPQGCRMRDRAALFSEDRSADEYLALLSGS